MSARPRAWVTYFDQRYLARALVMLRSLRRHDPEAALFVLAFDETTRAVVSALGDPALAVVTPEDLARFEPALPGCVARPRQAFYGTHKPVLPLYVLERRPDLAAVAHIDADTYFFSPPAAVFEEIGPASVAVSPHRFAAAASQSAYGAYNAGFIYWRNDAVGRRCLEDYRADCLRWCEPRFEPDGRYMNQGYLTAWPDRYEGVHVLQHSGANLAPWNLAGHRLAADHGVRVDGRPLVFYHFTNLLRDARGIWRTIAREFGANLPLALEAIYRPYLDEVEASERELRRQGWALAALEKASWKVEDAAPVRRGPWPRTPGLWLSRLRWSCDPAMWDERRGI
jgi:hypothetical protein